VPGETNTKGPAVADAFDLVMKTMEAISSERDADDPTYGSMIKQAIKRRHPGFNERAYGFRSFNDLLLKCRTAASSTRSRQKVRRYMSKPSSD